MSRRSRKFHKIVIHQPVVPAKKPLLIKILPVIVLLFAYVNVGIGSLFYPLDYDLGWHLKYGQEVVNDHVISSVNTYSVDMAGHRWLNSSWLSDVLRYLIFHTSYFQGLMVAGIVTMVITFYIFAKVGKLTWWDAALLFPLVVYMEIPLTSASFRAQLLSFTGMGVILWILQTYQHGSKRALFWLLPLFLLWTNLHGGFFLGILYIAAWVTLYIFQKVFLEKSETLLVSIKTHGFTISVALIGSLLVTLINPWGWELYAEHVLVDFTSHIDKINPSQFLVEWKPLYINSGLLKNHVIFGLIYTASCVVVIWRKRHVQLFPVMIIAGLMFIAAISSRRFAWTMYLLAIPVLAEATRMLQPKRIATAGIIAIIVSLGFFGYIWNKNIKNMNIAGFEWNYYCAMTGCSPLSAQFLLNSGLLGKKMYTTYDWGGWLIWNYPQIRPLVDGRMSTWVDDKGYNAFLDYIQYENNWTDINESKYDVVYLSPGKRALHNRLLELVKENKWKITYRDNYAFVFVRNPN